MQRKSDWNNPRCSALSCHQYTNSTSTLTKHHLCKAVWSQQWTRQFLLSQCFFFSNKNFTLQDKSSNPAINNRYSNMAKTSFYNIILFFFSNKFKNSKVVHDLVFKNKLMPHLLILERVGVPHKWIFQIIHTCPFKHQNLNCFTWRCLKKTTQKNSTGF